jgi:transcriptional regulator with GAF, ATPase, and Fis domain
MWRCSSAVLLERGHHTDARRRLMEWDWPGNVREMNNLLVSATVEAPIEGA